MSGSIKDLAGQVDGPTLSARIEEVGYPRALAEVAATLCITPETAMEVVCFAIGPASPLPDWLKACIVPISDEPGLSRVVISHSDIPRLHDWTPRPNNHGRTWQCLECGAESDQEERPGQGRCYT